MSHDTMPEAEKTEKLKSIKKDVYDGLIRDLLDVEAYPLAEVIYNEKIREKFDWQMEDHLTGLNVYAV